jgi:hypothetical protein
MPTEIITSGRFFQVWGYTVSHSELLFRSTKSKEFPTRIDVFLKGVEEFHLPTAFDGLSIEEATGEDLERLSVLRKATSLRHGAKIFVVKGKEFVGYVVALGIWCHEDEGEYYDPSFFATCIHHGVVPTTPSSPTNA